MSTISFKYDVNRQTPLKVSIPNLKRDLLILKKISFYTSDGKNVNDVKTNMEVTLNAGESKKYTASYFRFKNVVDVPENMQDGSDINMSIQNIGAVQISLKVVYSYEKSDGFTIYSRTYNAQNFNNEFSFQDFCSNNTPSKIQVRSDCKILEYSITPKYESDSVRHINISKKIDSEDYFEFKLDDSELLPFHKLDVVFSNISQGDNVFVIVYGFK